MSAGHAAEVASLQVLVKGEWVEWKRIDRQDGEHWPGNVLGDIKPPSRVVFLRPAERDE